MRHYKPRLSNKVAIITGAARGLGRACALNFAEQGADLVLLDIGHDLPGVPYPLGTEGQLNFTAEACREKGVAVLTEHVDIRNSSAINDAVGTAMARFGRIDVLVNNAGIAAPSGKITHDVTEEEWQLMLDIDLSGAWRMMKAVAPIMVKQRSGSIINVASTAGVVGYRNFVGYVAAKHGVIGLSKASALDYAPFSVRVNALCPGSVRDSAEYEGCMLSEIAKSLDISVDAHEETFVQAQPMNRLIEPEDIAGAAVWLASDESRQVTGSVQTVDGGFSAH